MRNKNYVVIDINTSCIDCAIVSKSKDPIMIPMGIAPQGKKEHIDVDDEIIELNHEFSDILNTLRKVLDMIEKRGDIEKDVIVSIPSEYLKVRSKVISIVIPKNKKVQAKTFYDYVKTGIIIEDEAGNTYENFYSKIINYSVIEQDTGNRQTRSILKLRVCHCYCDINLIKCIRYILNKYGYKDKIVPGQIYALNALLPKEERREPYIVVETEKESTTIYVANGDGIEMVDHADVSARGITNAFFDKLKTYENATYSDAETLLQKARFTLNAGVTYRYNIGEYCVVPSDVVNNIIEDNIEKIDEKIFEISNRFLQEKGLKITNTIYYIGEGLAKINGLKERYSQKFEEKISVKILEPNNMMYSGLNSAIMTSLINCVINKNFGK